MGSHYDFTCPGCGYHAEVSGGEDCGMVAVTTTISCQDCRKLRDVEVGKHGQVTKEPRCPRGKAHRFSLWTAGDPCPRCQTPIPQGELTVLWD